MLSILKPDCKPAVFLSGTGKDAKAVSSGTDTSRPASHTHSLTEESAKQKTDGLAELASSDKTGQTEPATWWQSWTAVMKSVWLELLQQPPRWHAVMAACFGIQLAMTLYFSLVHQRCVCPANFEASGRE